MDSGSNVEEPKSWDELYTLNLMPSELFLKFRKEIQGFRVGVNMEVSIYCIFCLLLSLLFSLYVVYAQVTDDSTCISNA